MRKVMILLAAVIALYLAASYVMYAIYGPSYGFLSGQNCWVPDGEGGWMKQGDPVDPPPDVPSIDVPLWAGYLPIFLPALLLALFIFTPLSRKLETKPTGDGQTDDAPPEGSPPEDG